MQKYLNEYDINEVFFEIELELIKSMTRNMKRHFKDEKINKVNFAQWQSEMLLGLEDFKKENKGKFNKEYKLINDNIEQLIEGSYADARLTTEKEILQSILKGESPKIPEKTLDKLKNVEGKTLKDKAETLLNLKSQFFKVNDRALNNLIKETTAPIKRGEMTTLRSIDDVYRQTIFKAQVAAQSGAMTTYKAVDIATKQFLEKGIQNIKYKNGTNVNIQSYSELAIRTAKKRAFLAGEGEIRQEWGISLVQVSSYGACSPICLNWQGKIYVDDVWSAGKNDGKHTLLSTAISAGLYHPNCRHTHSTFFEDINESSKELDKTNIQENYRLEQLQRYHERQIRKYKRLEEGSLDDSNKLFYTRKKEEWIRKNTELINNNQDILRRDLWRESSILKNVNSDTYKPKIKPKTKINILDNNNIKINDNLDLIDKELKRKRRI